MPKYDAIKSSYPPPPEFANYKEGKDITGERFPFHGKMTDHAEFSSPAEIEGFVAECCKSGEKWNWVSYDSADHATSPEWGWKWRGGQIIELSRRGWKEGAKLLGTPAIDTANAVVGGVDPNSFEMDVAGGSVDVAAYLEGVPECMVEFREREDKGRKLHIVLDGYTAGNTNARDLFTRGIALTSAILSLEALGVSVTVTLAKEVRNSNGPVGGKNLYLSVVLHRPEWTLDPARLAVWLGHPGWMRTIILPTGALLSGSSNHGTAREIKAIHSGPGIVCIDRAFGENWNLGEDGCRELVAKLMKQAA